MSFFKNPKNVKSYVGKFFVDDYQNTIEIIVKDFGVSSWKELSESWKKELIGSWIFSKSESDMRNEVLIDFFEKNEILADFVMGDMSNTEFGETLKEYLFSAYHIEYINRDIKDAFNEHIISLDSDSSDTGNECIAEKFDKTERYRNVRSAL